MGAEVLLLILVAVITVAFVVQAVVVWRTMRATGAMVQQVTQISEKLEHDVDNVVNELREVASSIERLDRVVEQIGNRAIDLNQMVADRAEDVDALVEELVQVARKQADHIDQLVSDTTHKFAQTTTVIQHDILRPVVEIASILKGLKTGIDYLFSRNRHRSGGAREAELPEEELFI